MRRQALKTLFDTYWSSRGWKSEAERRTSPEDFDAARRAGIMFDPIRRSHDETVRAARAVVAGIEPASVAAAFLASLSTRRLELRSALGSYAVLRHLPDHSHHDPRSACPTCGQYDRPGEDIDRNVLNFERLKWGGVCHDQVEYAAFDLGRFAAEDRPEPGDADRAILRGLLRAIGSAPPRTTGSQLQALLGGLLRSNKAERDVLVAILGFAGILRTPGHPGFGDHFVPSSDRELPPNHFVDLAYPACWWRASDGIDRAAVRAYFPALDL